MRDLTWKHVTIIVAFFATIAVLKLSGSDESSFILVGMGVLGGVGLIAVQTGQAKEQVTAVKEQTNGNLARLLDMLEAQGRMLAQMQPARAPADDQSKWEA